MRIVPGVLQEHISKGTAGRHYDLRIKHVNANRLASWALPKARIPIKSGDKVLAMRTPDHGIKWLNFQGKIVEKYGQGDVKIVQKFKAEILRWTSRIIAFNIIGSPLNGKYILFKYKTRESDKSWLLMKGKDN